MADVDGKAAFFFFQFCVGSTVNYGQYRTGISVVHYARTYEQSTLNHYFFYSKNYCTICGTQLSTLPLIFWVEYGKVTVVDKWDFSISIFQNMKYSSTYSTASMEINGVSTWEMRGKKIPEKVQVSKL